MKRIIILFSFIIMTVEMSFSASTYNGHIINGVVKDSVSGEVLSYASVLIIVTNR